MKKLHRSKEHVMLFGVLGGIGEYQNVDPTAVRLAFVALAAMTGLMPGVFTYIVAIFLVPKKA